MALVLFMMSKLVLLSNESLRDAEIWIFSCNLLCCRCHGRSVRRDSGDSYLHSAWAPHCLAITEKWWPKSLPFAKYEYFVAKRNATLWDFTFLLVSLCGWKKGQECKWFKFSYVLKKQPSCCFFLILSISNLTFDVDVLFFHKIDTFITFLTVSLENVKHWFPF